MQRGAVWWPTDGGTHLDGGSAPRPRSVRLLSQHEFPKKAPPSIVNGMIEHRRVAILGEGGFRGVLPPSFFGPRQPVLLRLDLVQRVLVTTDLLDLLGAVSWLTYISRVIRGVRFAVGGGDGMQSPATACSNLQEDP